MEEIQRLIPAEQVRRGVAALARRLRAERSGDSLSSGKLSILGRLIRRGPMTPGELAAAEFLQPQSLTRILAELELAQLVVRTPHASDRRRSLVEVTGEGRAAVGRDMAARDRWLAGAMAELTPAEREVLLIAATLMEQLADGDARAAAAPRLVSQG